MKLIPSNLQTADPQQRNKFLVRQAWIFCLCALIGVNLFLNASSPSFVYTDFGALYNDGHYIASVAKNITQGHGVSYWDGLKYRVMDPEISTGPLVFLPLSLSLYAGMDEWLAFSTTPIIVNLILFAWLLFRLPKTLPFIVFASVSLAGAIVSMSYQRWMWFLPLGEVPAALCLLLAISYFSECTANVSTRNSNLLKAGALLSLAILGKMLVTLTLPAFVFFLLRKKEKTACILAFGKGLALIFSVYFVFCLYTMPRPSLMGLVGRVVDYILWNLNFGITRNYSGIPGDAQPLTETTMGYLLYNWQNLPAIGDSIGRIKSSIVLFSAPVAAAITYWGLRRSEEKILLPAFAALCIMSWYFFFGQNGARYFFIAGYTSVWCLLLISTLKFIRHNYIAPLLSMVVALAFLALSRPWIFPSTTTFQYLEDSALVSDYLDENTNKLPNVLINIAMGYPEISYYLDNKNYRTFPAYLDLEATLISPASCAKKPGKPLIPPDGLTRHPLIKCLMNNPETQVVYQWKNNNPGFLIASTAEGSNEEYKPYCKTVLFNTQYHFIQQCRKVTLAKFINHESEGRVIVLPAP